MPADHPESPLTPDQSARAKFMEDTGELMKLPAFRRWALHLIDYPGWCDAFAPFDPECKGAIPKEPIALYFALGKREIGLVLQQLLKGVAPERYRDMLIEAIGLKTQRESRVVPKE